MSEEKITGSVKWFDNAKGYGFIAPDESEDDVFVHHSDIQAEGFRTLQEGERVEFTITQAPKGPQASNVVKLGDTASRAGDEEVESDEDLGDYDEDFEDYEEVESDEDLDDYDEDFEDYEEVEEEDDSDYESAIDW